MIHISGEQKQYLKYFFRLSFIYSCIILFSISCSGMVKKQINTKWEFSNGLRDGNIVYFLTEYTLYQSGKIIIPLYFKNDDKYHFDNVFLYSFNTVKKNLSRLAVVKPSVPGSGRSDVKYTRFAKENHEIFLLSQSGWDKEKKKLKNALFKYNVKDKTFKEITEEAEMDKLHTKYFTIKPFLAAKSPTFVSSPIIRSLIGDIQLSEWEFPSPLDYTKLGNSELEGMLIEIKGDRFYREAILAKFKKEYSFKDLNNIIAKMEKRLKALDSYNKRVYMPYFEEYSTKIQMIAKFEKSGGTEKVPQVIIAANQGNNREIVKLIKEMNSSDEDGLTALMTAAYFDRKETAGMLLNNGANINAKDKNGCTPLMYAVFGKAGNTLRLLFERGADRRLKTNSGWIAWMFVAVTPLRKNFLELEEKYSKTKKKK